MRLLETRREHHVGLVVCSWILSAMQRAAMVREHQRLNGGAAIAGKGGVVALSAGARGPCAALGALDADHLDASALTRGVLPRYFVQSRIGVPSSAVSPADTQDMPSGQSPSTHSRVQ